ncbi:MAG: flagellar basal-body MS-ring/collar protein FliF [Acidimicrobiia bacterium]
MALDIDRARRQAQQFFGGFTTGQKVVSALVAAGLVLGGMFFTSWVSNPSYGTLFTNLDSKDASAITGQLTSKGVSYKLADGGATIQVPQDKVYQLRLDMSSAGLPSGGANAGYSLLDKQGITTSEFSQHVDYQRAMEGELAKTISALDSVSSASVHLVIQSQDVFSEDTQKPTASVLVATKGGVDLGQNQAQAIRHLVASSISGMDPKDVTIADTKGNVLAAPGTDDGANGDAGQTGTTKYEKATTASVQQMLDKVLGSGHAVVQVKAQMNFDQKATTSETYAVPTTAAGGTATPPTEQSQSSETLTGTGGTNAAGVLGPNGTPLANGSGNTNYNKTESATRNTLDKTVTETKAQPGSVVKQSIAVILDQKVVKQADVTNLTSQIQAAAGFDATRGDTVQVNTMKFDTSAAKAAAKAMAGSGSGGMMAMLKTVLMVVFVGLVLFLARRNIKKAAAARPPVRVPLDLRQIEMGSAADGAYGELGAGAGVPALMAAESRPAPEIQPEIGDLIERQPDEVAATLRNWLADRRT